MKRLTNSESETVERKRKRADDPAFSLRTFLANESDIKSFPYFREPIEIGSFSQDAVHDFVPSKQQLRYLHYEPLLKSVQFDLRVGYKDFTAKDEQKKFYIDHMLQWILGNPVVFQLHNQHSQATKQDFNLNTDFVSWRGLLTKLLTTPYESRDGWRIAVTLYRGTWYLCEFDTDEIRQETERQKEMSYWGLKFEQYMCADSPDSLPDPSVRLNSNLGFCSVVRSRLKQHSLVYGAEVDCCVINAGKQKFVELKTNRQIDNKRQEDNFKRFKLLKWWAQSFLVGIDEIICGFRDDNGLVHTLQSFKTLDMPKMARSWSGAVCFNFLDSFLNHVKEVVTREDPRQCCVFEWAPANDISHYWTDSRTFQFLPDWYITRNTEQHLD